MRSCGAAVPPLARLEAGVAALWLLLLPPAAAAELTFSQWGSVSPVAGWSFVAGNFTPAAGDDVVGYHPSNGSLWVGGNTGSDLSFSQWSSVSPAAGWSFVAGDFSGDGLDDVVGYYADEGELWIGVNTGSAFEFELWSSVTPVGGWSFVAANFAGSAADDLVGYHPSDGSLWMFTSDGAGFVVDFWQSLGPAAGWSFAAGNLDGSGAADVVGYHPSNGSLWAGLNNGGSFGFSQWATVSPAAGWELIGAGSFTGAGRDDVALYFAGQSDPGGEGEPGRGGLWLALNTGSAFAFSREFVVSPATDWAFDTGGFSTAAVEEIIGYHPSNGSLWVGSKALEGYAWPMSGAPGDTIEFMVSGIGSSTVSFRRHVSTDGGITSTELGMLEFTPTVQAVPPQAWRDGCGWSPSFDLTIPADWPSGLYSAVLTSTSGAESHATFVVNPDPQQRSHVAVLANINTWLAYNGWGGRSKYDGAALASFLRPNPHAAPDGADGPFVETHLTRAELWVLGWLEAEGHAPDLYTDLDLHSGTFLDHYDVLILSTHPEYWTFEMYDKLAAFLDRGGTLLYLAGNGLFERGAYTADGTQMVFWEGVGNDDGAADLREPALFRYQLSPPRPERALLGVATEACGVPAQPFRVEADGVGHPLLADTGLGLHDPFGTLGFNRYPSPGDTGAASAWETDTSNGPGATGHACGIGVSPVPPSPLPRGLQVLARAPGPSGAELVFHRPQGPPGGGFVLSAGSITVGGSLLLDAPLAQIVRNALADHDVDGLPDLADSCPWYASEERADSDGDGRGDVCECGDQNGDGTVNVRDILAINSAIFNPGQITPLCDANADGRCNVQDILAVNAEIFSPGIAVCARQPQPGLP